MICFSRWAFGGFVEFGGGGSMLNVRFLSWSWSTVLSYLESEFWRDAVGITRFLALGRRYPSLVFGARVAVRVVYGVWSTSCGFADVEVLLQSYQFDTIEYYRYSCWGESDISCCI